jgi:orotidine-5'-phosphate decarboxylase
MAEMAQTKLPAPTRDLRLRVALAFDFDDLVVAMRWAARLRPYFGVAKVGLELFSAAGPSALTEFFEAGWQVFADMKLADIPTTTRRAARVFGSLGASYLTVHTSAGAGSLRAAADGLAEGAGQAGLAPPVALGVTALTSDPEVPPGLVAARAALAAESGCGGVVCAAVDLAEVRCAAPGLLTVVPGIRLAGQGSDDQSRAATPGQALAAGADMLVVGRAVTMAEDPEAAAREILGSVAAASGALGPRREGDPPRDLQRLI